MSRVVNERIAHFCGQARIRAGSLITTVVGDVVLPRGGRIWLGSLIGLLQPLGLSDRLVRTSVFRLAKDEWLFTEALGRRADYVLTPVGQRRFEEASRQIYALRTPHWDRRWRLVLALGELGPRHRDALRRALFWQGFGTVGADCFVHPGADLDTVFDTLQAEGLGELLPQLMPLLSEDVPMQQSGTAVALVRRAWNLDALAKAYDDFERAYRPLHAELQRSCCDASSDEAAFLARILLIHDYRRLLLRDPELPDELLPAGWPGRRARELCAGLYRQLLAPSEAHLDRTMQHADGTVPSAVSALNDRFSPA